MIIMVTLLLLLSVLCYCCLFVCCSCCGCCTVFDTYGKEYSKDDQHFIIYMEDAFMLNVNLFHASQFLCKYVLYKSIRQLDWK